MGREFFEQAKYSAVLFSQVLGSSISQKEVLLNALYSCLNRAILYCLSRPQQSLPEQFNVLNTLSVLQEQWDLIFATYNSNNNFIICLMYCLFQLNSGRYKYSSQYNVCLHLCAFVYGSVYRGSFHKSWAIVILVNH